MVNDALIEDLCFGDGFSEAPDDEERAQALLRELVPYRTYRVPLSEWRDPSCIPLGLKANWLFSFHSLTFVESLRRRYDKTQEPLLLAAYVRYVADWVVRCGAVPEVLPTAKQPGDFRWYDMATANRSLVLISATRVLGLSPWLMAVLRTHRDVLLREGYYVPAGNHALHQSSALLALGMVLEDPASVRLAVDRIVALRLAKVDDDGVAMEGSLGYQFLNAHWWLQAVRRVEVARRVYPDLPRLDLPPMHRLMTHAVAPDGSLALLGDTTRGSHPVLQNLQSTNREEVGNFPHEYPLSFLQYIVSEPGLRFALTQGAEGEPPAECMAVFRDGYVFSRNHWGAASAKPPVSLVTLRFGAGLAERVHGHDDAGAVTYYVGQVRILEDGGMFGYYGKQEREFVKKNAAHCTVMMPERKYYRKVHNELVCSETCPDGDIAQVFVRALQRARWHRTVIHGRAREFLVIQDVLRTGEPLSAQEEAWQLWQLGDGIEVDQVAPDRVDISGCGMRAVLFWLAAPRRIDVVSGQKDPWLGWRSTREGELHPIRTVRAAFSGSPIKTTACLIPLLDGVDPGSVTLRKFANREKSTALVVRVAQEEWTIRFEAGRVLTVSVRQLTQGPIATATDGGNGPSV